MKFKSLLLAGIVSISSSVFAANPMNGVEAGGWACVKGVATCSTSHRHVLETALSKAARGQPLLPDEAGKLSSALFDSEIAGILLRALQTQGNSQSSSYIPSGDPRSLDNSSAFNQQAAKPNAGQSMVAQEPRHFVAPRPLNPDVPQTAGGHIDGLQVALENRKTITFDDFKIRHESGDEIPQAREILEKLELFCAPTEEVREKNRGSKLLYLYGEAGTGKTTAAVIAMRELEKRGHNVMYVSSKEIELFSFDFAKFPHSVVVIDDFNTFPKRDGVFSSKLVKFILDAYDKPSIRIVITSNHPLGRLEQYLVTDPYVNGRVTNADQIQSRFNTLCKRAGAPAGLCFDGLPMRRM